MKRQGGRETVLMKKRQVWSNGCCVVSEGEVGGSRGRESQRTRDWAEAGLIQGKCKPCGRHRALSSHITEDSSFWSRRRSGGLGHAGSRSGSLPCCQSQPPEPQPVATFQDSGVLVLPWGLFFSPFTFCEPAPFPTRPACLLVPGWVVSPFPTSDPLFFFHI